jgi:glucose-6-phosphate 1-dehydrogenase
MSPEEAQQELSHRADAIEGGYEMMLAYAAQGLASDQGAANSAQLRDHLKRFDSALTGLAQVYRDAAVALGVGPQDSFENLLKTLDADATFTQSALRVVMALPGGISSQMIDNMNASIHVRALLTDVFVIDELIRGKS